MPLLEQLVRNLENYKYYSGVGTFNANNLPYGKDTPGGGSSKQPFIVRNVDQRWSPSNFDDGFTPFGMTTLVSRTAADLTRVTQFLFTTVKGPLFLLKQTGLQRINPNIRQVDVDNFEKKIAPTQLYNPAGLNTLAQVALGPLGARLTKHGLVPQNPEQRDYENYIRALDRGDERGENKKNRLTGLLNKLTNPNVDVLYKYRGGPESIFGIGNTTIKRYVKSIYREKDPILDPESKFISIPIANLQSLQQDGTIQVDNRKFNDPNYVAPFTPGPKEYKLGSNFDFRKYKNAILTDTVGQRPDSIVRGAKLPTGDYEEYNIEKRIGVAIPRKAVDRTDYSSEAEEKHSDRINLLGLYYNNIPYQEDQTLLDVNDRPVNKDTTRDLIKFKIKILDNDVKLNAKGNNYGVYVMFRAYITNIKRGFQSKWDAYKYVGRGESFYAYDGYTETITVSFTIAASSRTEMKPLYQKLNYLISSLAPDYSQAFLMRGNIAELTIGDFVLYQPGVITNFDMIIDEDSNWEIALSEPEKKGSAATTQRDDSDMHELPQLIKCSMTFIPIYNFLPRKSSQAPFIGISGIESGVKKKWLEYTENGQQFPISNRLKAARIEPIKNDQ